MAYVQLTQTQKIGLQVIAECRHCGQQLLADATVQPYKAEIVVQVAPCRCPRETQDNQSALRGRRYLVNLHRVRRAWADGADCHVSGGPQLTHVEHGHYRSVIDDQDEVRPRIETREECAERLRESARDEQTMREIERRDGRDADAEIAERRRALLRIDGRDCE